MRYLWLHREKNWLEETFVKHGSEEINPDSSYPDLSMHWDSSPGNQGIPHLHFPMQNSLKILPSRSSVSSLPITSPTASRAPRNSIEINSGDLPFRKLWPPAERSSLAFCRQAWCRALIATRTSASFTFSPITLSQIAWFRSSRPALSLQENRTAANSAQSG